MIVDEVEITFKIVARFDDKNTTFTHNTKNTNGTDGGEDFLRLTVQLKRQTSNDDYHGGW